MKRGRKPTPTALKVARGNPGKRKLNTREPKPAQPEGAPAAPRRLTGIALAKWNELAPELHRTGVYTVVDVDALERYCLIYQRWVEAEECLVKEGFITLTDKKNQIQNPYLAVANRCIKQLDSLASSFGLTPSSRSGVKSEPPPAEESLENELFGKPTKVVKKANAKKPSSR